VVTSGAEDDGRGTTYAVYRLLEAAGFRFFAEDETRRPVGGCPTELPRISRTFTPAFVMRDNDAKQVANQTLWATRVGYNGDSTAQPAAYGGHFSYADPPGMVHTVYALLWYPLTSDDGVETTLPPTTLYETHPEWFWPRNAPTTSGQVCWSNSSLVEYLTAQARRVLTDQPHASVLSISQMDNSNYCTDDAERAISTADGSLIGPMLRAVNQIATTLQSEYPNILFDTLAYQWSRAAPNSSLVAASNVDIRLCSIECDFAHPMDYPTNKDFYSDLQAWSRKTDQLFIWDYATNFHEYFTPYPNYRTLGANARIYYQNGVVGMFSEGVYNTWGGDMMPLKNYMLAKQLWDPEHADADALISEFLPGYYGEAAAPHLKKYIDTIEESALAWYVQPDQAEFTEHEKTIPMPMHVGEYFEVTAQWLPPPTVLDAARAMTRAHNAAKAAAEQQLGDETPSDERDDLRRFVPRIEFVAAPIMYVTLRRWAEMRQYHEENECAGQRVAAFSVCQKEWPYSDSLREQYEVFAAAFEAMGATRLFETGWNNITYLEHLLLDSSPPPLAPSPPAAPSPPSSPPPRYAGKVIIDAGDEDEQYTELRVPLKEAPAR